MTTELGEGCSHGVKWGVDCVECDTVWGRSFMTAEQQALAVFYNVNTKDELIAAQAHHVEKLQQNYAMAVKGRAEFRDAYRTIVREG